MVYLKSTSGWTRAASNWTSDLFKCYHEGLVLLEPVHSGLGAQQHSKIKSIRGSGSGSVGAGCYKKQLWVLKLLKGIQHEQINYVCWGSVTLPVKEYNYASLFVCKMMCLTFNFGLQNRSLYIERWKIHCKMLPDYFKNARSKQNAKLLSPSLFWDAERWCPCPAFTAWEVGDTLDRPQVHHRVT